MRIERTTVEKPTTAQTDIEDLSQEIQGFLDSCGVEQGWLLVFVPGSTAAITTIEFESGAVEDLKRAIDSIAPESGEYEHNLRWGDGNGYSHVRAALMGPSLTLPIIDGRLDTGTWQQVVFCDFDNRPRTRRIQLQIIGD